MDEHKLLRDIERLLKREIPRMAIAGYEPDPSIKAEPIQNGRQQQRGRGPGNGGGQGRSQNGEKRTVQRRPNGPQNAPQGDRPARSRRPAAKKPA